MKKNILLFKILVLCLLFSDIGKAAQTNYFNKGKDLFNKKDYVKSKILFERDLVFNPKNEMSYLYLAKIFDKNNNDEEQEINLKNVLLLNPQNDEAVYMLTILKIKQSDYNEAKELMDKFNLICKSFCSKKNEIKSKFEKLTPEDAKSNN